MNMTDYVGSRKHFPALWWAVHNLIAHPLGEVLYWAGLIRLSNWLHDQTVPIHESGGGRG